MKVQKNLYGLVLSGGKSTRMGEDKGNIVYHNKAQRAYLADMLQYFCEKVCISCRPEQEICSEYELIFDSYESEGPMVALLSAFGEYPQKAWLVVACDMPMIEKETFQFLIQNREKSSIATAFQHSETKQIEPLIAIWESNSYPILKDYYDKNYKSPLRVLKENNVNLVETPNQDWLLNINSPNERKALGNHESIYRPILR